MGRRFQAYIAGMHRPPFKNREQFKVVGVHNQYMYGAVAVRALCRIMNLWLSPVWNGSARRSNWPDVAFQFDMNLRLLASAYSLDEENGYFEAVNAMEHKWVIDPRLNDNNDGISIIDLRNLQTPKYCFMRVAEEVDGATRHLAHFGICNPLSAEDYLNAYIGEKGPSSLLIVLSDGELKDRLRAERDRLIDQTKEWPVLSLQECTEIFPKMYDGVPLKRRLAGIAGNEKKSKKNSDVVLYGGKPGKQRARRDIRL
jgi:hypothetical protein